MEQLKFGQTLWRWNSEDKTEYSVKVIGVFKNCFVAEYRNSAQVVRRAFNYSILGKNLFTYSHLKKMEIRSGRTCPQHEYGYAKHSAYCDSKNDEYHSNAYKLSEKYISIARNETKTAHSNDHESDFENRSYSMDPVPEKIQTEIENIGKEKSKEPSCTNCFYHKNGECTSLQNKVCTEYRAIQKISESESANWPKYGDACAAGMHNKKRYNE